MRRKFDRDPWKKPVTPELKPLVPRASSSALPSSKIDPVSVNIGLNEGFEADAALGASMPHNVVIVQSGPAGDSSRAVAEQVPVAASPSQTGQIDLEGLVASMQTGMRYCG